MYLLSRILLGLCVLTCTTQSLKILALFPHPGRSHFNVFEPFLQALAAKGHNLTVLSPFPQKEPLENYHDISIKEYSNIIFGTFDIQPTPNSIWSRFGSLFKLAGIAQDICKTLRSKPVQELIRSDEKFDLIITEIFNTDCYLGFVHKFNVPFVGVCPNVIMTWSNSIFGNPVNPSYIPNQFAAYSDRMSFLERLENTLFYMYVEIGYKYLMVNPSYEEAKIHFGKDLPHLNDIVKNVSVMLVNTHFSLNLPRPFVPNIIEVGGMFLGNPKKIPQEIESILADAKDGVIYFSMGSMLKGHTFPIEKRKLFLKVFSQLNQKILWKYENDTIPEQPNNVFVKKWLPQYEVLCHPNTVAFISHGGLLGMSEAVQCGVPVVVLPQYGDQFINAKALETNEGGVTLDLSTVTEQSLLRALQTVLEPSFQNKMKDLSNRFRDRPVTPLNTAIYWTEYAARHGTSFHMKSAATDLYWFQYLLLDVTAFLVLSFVLLILIIKYSFQFVCRKMIRKIKTH